MIALDTNLLVYAFRAAVPEHSAAKRALERAFDDPRGSGIALPCISEFWSVVTHPSAIGGPSTPTLAAKFIGSLIDQTELHIWLPTEGFMNRFLKLGADMAVTGHRIFDLQIGAIAMEHGAREIWTHDRNFLPLPGLRVVDPLG